MKFRAFIDDIIQNQWNVFGVEVYVDGKLAHQYGDTTKERHPIYSATKTITSIAVGMAADEGKLDIQQPILTYLPADIVDRLPKAQRDVYQHITTKRLLTMSVAGYPFRPSGDSWLEESLRLPLENTEVLSFDYSNISAYLAGVVATYALQEDLYQYLQRKLFVPLGIENPPYTRCPDGFFYGASAMELTVNELSKIGLFLYHGGKWEDKQLLSEAYVRDATSIQQMNREGGYGYFIWKYRNGFSINGKWKQKCYVLPSDKIVISYLANIQDEFPGLKESMEKNLLGLDR